MQLSNSMIIIHERNHKLVENMPEADIFHNRVVCVPHSHIEGKTFQSYQLICLSQHKCILTGQRDSLMVLILQAITCSTKTSFI